jgi:hypothetical protein
MKKLLSLTLAAALTLAMLTACGCSANVSTHPGGMITEETTHIMPTPTATHETTRPTETTRPHATMPTVDGSMPTDNATPDGTTGMNTTPTDTTTENRSHRAMPNR